jgi:hypothetical protein
MSGLDLNAVLGSSREDFLSMESLFDERDGMVKVIVLQGCICVYVRCVG